MNGHILVIKTGALGDIVIARPAIEAIRDHHPGAAITVLTTPAYAALVALIPEIRVTAFHRKGWIHACRLRRWLRASRFDVAYDLQGSRHARRAADWSGAPVLHRLPPERPAEHACARLGRLLRDAGLTPPAVPPRWPAPAEARSRMADWMAAQGFDPQRLVLVHAGTSRRWPTKRWPPAHFAALARRLAGDGMQIAWIGGPDDAALNRRLVKAAGTGTVATLDIPCLLALAERACLGIGNDSGPMHLMAAAGLPVYGLFGPTDWRRSHAVGQRDRALHIDVDCGPCHRRRCPRRHRHRCMTDLDVETVWRAINEQTRDG